MPPLIRRYHLLEINDQSWFPDILRSRVQACLTLLWTFKIPILQRFSPASLVAITLRKVLGSRSSEFTYVDFCSGAGGPTLAIEKAFNNGLDSAAGPESDLSDTASAASFSNDGTHDDGASSTIMTPQSSPSAGTPTLMHRRHKGEGFDSATLDPEHERPDKAYFVLTDIAPHLTAWEAAASQSPRIRYVADSVDAANAPDALLKHVFPEQLNTTASTLPIFRLFSLAFHHFDDPLAERIVSNTLDTSAGFAILELQGRNISSQIMTILLFPLMLLISPFFFWNDPVHLLFTYLLPVVPLVVAVDGMVSSVRTRTGEEVRAMVHKVLREKGLDVDDWVVLWGSEWHTWPLGEMSWVVGLKKTDASI